MQNTPHTCTPLRTTTQRRKNRRAADQLAQQPATLQFSSTRLLRIGAAWLNACRAEGMSAATISLRTGILTRLDWWLHHFEYRIVDADAIRAFLIYLAEGPSDGSPRWPNQQASTPGKPGTVATYHRALRALCRWAVAEGEITEDPTARVKAPIDRPDQLNPFITEDVKALLAAAKHGHNPERDLAIILLLLDTGIRASELTAMMATDLDMETMRVRVEGKGGKTRTVWFSGRTASAIGAYLRVEQLDLYNPNQPLWLGQKGPITRSGLQQILERIAQRAGVEKCHPHRFRHTYALWSLRSGAERGAVQELIGHTDMRMTARYVRLAALDLKNTARKSSPVDSFFNPKRRANL